jgi:hypothetical protein
MTCNLVQTFLTRLPSDSINKIASVYFLCNGQYKLKSDYNVLNPHPHFTNYCSNYAYI